MQSFTSFILFTFFVAFTSFASSQAPPSYKSSTSSIPMQILIKDKAGKPRLGLTADDLTFRIDGKARSFAFVSAVADKPGYYLLNFEPAQEDRDGKEHSLEISVRGGGTLKKKLKLPKER